MFQTYYATLYIKLTFNTLNCFTVLLSEPWIFMFTILSLFSNESFCACTTTQSGNKNNKRWHPLKFETSFVDIQKLKFKGQMSHFFHGRNNYFCNHIEGKITRTWLANEEGIFFLIRRAKLLGPDWLKFRMFLCLFHVGHF